MSPYPDLHQKCMKSILVWDSAGISNGCMYVAERLHYVIFSVLHRPSTQPDSVFQYGTERHLEMRDRWIPAITTESRLTSYMYAL